MPKIKRAGETGNTTTQGPGVHKSRDKTINNIDVHVPAQHHPFLHFLLFILIVLFISGCGIGVYYAEIHYSIFNDYEKGQHFVFQNVESPSGKYYVDGDVGKSHVEAMNATLAQIPVKVRDEYFSDGGKIIMTKTVPTDVGGSAYTGAFYKQDKKLIIYIDYNKNSIANSLGHQFGHYLDDKYKISSGKDFEAAYNKEKVAFRHLFKFDPRYMNFFYEDTVANEQEYMAEAVQMMTTQPDEVLRYCPDTYNILKSYLWDKTE